MYIKLYYLLFICHLTFSTILSSPCQCLHGSHMIQFKHKLILHTHSGEHWWEQNIFCSFTTPQAFWQSSAPGCFDEHSLVTSVVLYSLTQATLSVSDESWDGRTKHVYVDIYIYINIDNSQYKNILAWTCDAMQRPGFL